SNLLVLKEQGQLMEAEGRYGAANKLWQALAAQLKPKASQSPPIKENFLECYYHELYCYRKAKQQEKTAAERAKALETTAQAIVNLERSWEEFGSDASKKRFTEWLASDGELNKAYLRRKGVK